MARRAKGDEKRTQRATLLMTPEIYDGLLNLAQIQNRTINDFACSILEQIVKQNLDVIAAFKADKAKHSANVNVSVPSEST